MGQPQRIRLTAGRRRAQLDTDGANLAEYLLNISRQSPQAFQGILGSLRYVLPYVTELQVASTSEIERLLYLQMGEGDAKLPGWLLSTGTLRIVALLAVLRHPEPPPVVFIEEIENGLDPRTIHLIVEEIRSAVQYGGMQVVITTHSPYLLDLLPLSTLVLCERDETGQPRFYRPTNDESMQRWARDFAPGQLYTMGQLQRKL